jgi:insertion element IS1 protein InsB
METQRRNLAVPCPSCSGTKVKKNGWLRRQSAPPAQRLLCTGCGKSFIANRVRQRFSEADLPRVEQALQERRSLRGILRIFKIGWSRLYGILKSLMDRMPANFGLDASRLGDRCQVDEIWTFCGSKDWKIWVWLARDEASGQIAGMHLGGRDKEAFEELIGCLPRRYASRAVFCTDDFPVYSSVLPAQRHIVGKEHTWSIEGFNNRVRQLCNRFTRKTSGFSRKYNYHFYLLYICICQFNLATVR